ncbi:MAG: hypothetical protein WD557_01055 [Dehalococcoidia bacterium]
MRWQELVAAERALDEMSEYLGQRLVHPEVEEQLSVCREKILELHIGAQAVAGTFALPEPTEVLLEAARNRIPWDDLKPTEVPGNKQWNPRDGLHATVREEVEAAEQEWLAMLAPRLG